MGYEWGDTVFSYDALVELTYFAYIVVYYLSNTPGDSPMQLIVVSKQ